MEQPSSSQHIPRKLAALYEKFEQNFGALSDEQILAEIRNTYWPTNCWGFVEMSFAIIAPACELRPHLTRELIGHPIEAMIAGGLKDPDDIIPQGVACATKPDPYVIPLPEAKQWLLEEWPLLKDLVYEVYHQKLADNDALLKRIATLPATPAPQISRPYSGPYKAAIRASLHYLSRLGRS